MLPLKVDLSSALQSGTRGYSSTESQIWRPMPGLSGLVAQTGHAPIPELRGNRVKCKRLLDETVRFDDTGFYCPGGRLIGRCWLGCALLHGLCPFDAEHTSIVLLHPIHFD